MDTKQFHDLLDRLADLNEAHGQRVPVCIVGLAGVGKTTIVKDWAKARDYDCVVKKPGQAESAGDLIGMPEAVETYPCPDCLGHERYYACELAEHVKEHDKSLDEAMEAMQACESLVVKKQRYSIPDDLPSRGRGVLFLDEINRAPPDIQNALLELTCEFSMSQCGYTLPEGWIIVAAMNPPTSEYGATVEMDEAMRGRFAFFNLVPREEDWLSWAKAEGLDARIVGFFGAHKPFLGCKDFENPVTADIKEGSPRLAAMLANLSLVLQGPLLQEAAMGLIGVEGAEALSAFLHKGEVAVEARDVLSDYESVRKAIRKQRAEERIDMLNQTITGLLEVFEHREAMLEPAEAANLVRFVGDIPRDLCVKLTHVISEPHAPGHSYAHFEYLRDEHPEFEETAYQAFGKLVA